MRQFEVSPMQVAFRFAMDEEIQGDSYFDAVMANCGIDQLPAGKVLDIGSGPRGLFQYEAALYAPNSEVVSISPVLGYPSRHTNRDVYLNGTDPANSRLTEEQLALVRGYNFLGAAALAQSLPFANEAFDLVFSHASIPVHLPHGDFHITSAFSEALRVAKKDSRVIFAPMYDFIRDLSLEKLNEMCVEPASITTEEIPVPEHSDDHGYNEWFRVSIQKS